MAWQALALLAVIDLSELPALEGDRLRPPDGYLNLFYDVEKAPWGLTSSDADARRVVYTPATQAVETPPPPKATTFPSYPLVGVQTLTIPSWEDEATRHLPDDDVRSACSLTSGASSANDPLWTRRVVETVDGHRLMILRFPGKDAKCGALIAPGWVIRQAILAAEPFDRGGRSSGGIWVTRAWPGSARTMSILTDPAPP